MRATFRRTLRSHSPCTLRPEPSFADRQKAGRRISIRCGNPFEEGPAETYAIELEPIARAARPQDGISETLKNRNLRNARKPQWGRADAAREYWRRRLDWNQEFPLLNAMAFLKALTIPRAFRMIGGR